MEIGLVEAKDVESFILKRLDSGKWWVLAEAVGGTDIVHAIEERFYSGKKNADLEVLFGGPITYWFARKSRMTSKQLYQLLVEFGADETSFAVETIEQNNIIGLMEHDDASL